MMRFGCNVIRILGMSGKINFWVVVLKEDETDGVSLDH